MLTKHAWEPGCSGSLVLTCYGSRFCPWLLVFWSWGSELDDIPGTSPVTTKFFHFNVHTCLLSLRFMVICLPLVVKVENSNLSPRYVRVCVCVACTCCKRVSCWAMWWALCSFWLKGRSSLFVTLLCVKEAKEGIGRAAAIEKVFSWGRETEGSTTLENLH